jgi:anti-sigma regulatory factor (Ser/Thr protein kinase)
MLSRPQESVTIENRLAEMAHVERWLADVMGRWAVPDGTVFAVDLVINEAVTNVIRHAYSDTDTHVIVVSVTDADNLIVVEVVDDGVAFDPFDAPPMAASPDLEHASIGGRGIHLIKSFSAEHHYERIAEQNRLTLAIRKEE